VNLLAGRALLKQMHPFVPEELGDDFDLARVLRSGSLPVIWADVEPERSLEAYVRLFLKDEIRAEGHVRNFPAFARFFQVASLTHAQTINVASLSRDAGVARSTLLDHLSILEDTYVIFRLPAFESRLRVRERKQPKLYWVDPGLVRAAAGRKGEVSPDERGPLLEGWVASVLRTYGDQRELFDSMSYWSPHQSRVEVDFVLRRGKELLAIEVKSAGRIKPEHMSGLRAIGEHERVVRRILVYVGAHRLHMDGIDAWPVGEFLGALATDSLWP
jgi:predicted AAA+ superfamily ATPase